MDGTSWFISNVAIRQRVTNRKGRSSGMSGIVAAVISSAAVQSKEVAAGAPCWGGESNVLGHGRVVYGWGKYEAGQYVFPKTRTNS